VCAPRSPSCIWSRAIVYEFEQVRALSENGGLRSRLLELLVTHPLLHAWWQRYENLKRKVTWRAEQCRRTGRYELHIEAALPSAAQNQDSGESDDDSQSQGPSDRDKQACPGWSVVQNPRGDGAGIPQAALPRAPGGRSHQDAASQHASRPRPTRRAICLPRARPAALGPMGAICVRSAAAESESHTVGIRPKEEVRLSAGRIRPSRCASLFSKSFTQNKNKNKIKS